jgi:aminopeptidase N
MRLLLFTLLYSVFLFLGCKTSQETASTMIEAEFDHRMLDTLMVVASKEDPKYDVPDYRASATRKHDLLHTRLDVKFDWAKQYVLGLATLQLKPLFYATDSLILDAKVFDIHSVQIDGKELSYDYDQYKLRIDLGKTYTREDLIEIEINYTAKPNEGPSGGSQAITSDKGLFFINPTRENKFKPQQIWTQGETENSSRWFPTIDKPNERCTQEVYITVEDRFQTLSNGLLLNSTKNNDGTRTDYWKQEKPHAPYLFMLGIGEYAIVKDTWKDMELMYYVEPEYEAHAKSIFNHTPEMLTFFSGILDYPYPWDKYAQIVCRDYVSGAMENTGAVVFGDFVQQTTRELLDGNNDDIVAHEMFHHWFGDLVTCESWSNLTLNEGFATYSEYLWQEYKYGHEAAERKRIEDLNGYLMTANRGGTRDLIDFEYKDKEDMFDGHSYNKGGLIVHMLRNLVGDEAFYASLNRYLTRNEYTDVEAHELRLAFEDVTGMDLNWFFNQWFFDQGHPILDVSYTYDAQAKAYYIDVEQTQDAEDNVPVFQLPVNAALYYANGDKEYVALEMNQRKQRFTIDLEESKVPEIVVFDGQHDLLAVIREERTYEEYVQLYKLSDEYGDKFKALSNLKGRAAGYEITKLAAQNPSDEMRLIAAQNLVSDKDIPILRQLALNDSNSKVRVTALKKVKDPELALQVLSSDKSYRVIAEALSIVNDNDPEEAVRQAEILTREYHKPLIGVIGDILASSGDLGHLDYFEENINSVGMYAFFNYMNHFSKLARTAGPDRMLQTAAVLRNVAAEESNSYFKKYSAANTIKSLMSELDSRKVSDAATTKAINEMSMYLSKVINTSTDERLREAFSEYIEMP